MGNFLQPGFPSGSKKNVRKCARACLSERGNGRETEIGQHRGRNKRGKAVPVCKCVIKRQARDGGAGRGRQRDIERETETDKRETKRDRGT